MLWPLTCRRDSDGVAVIGGCRVSDLADRYGTPLYIFDRETLVDRAQRIISAFAERALPSRVVFGGKANLLPAVISLLQGEGIGLDVVSGGEMWGALRAGIPAADMVFHGNNKPDAELRMAVENGVGLIVVDNTEEIARLDRIAGMYGRTQAKSTKVRVALRLNPGVDVHTHAKISTGIVDSKFGFPLWDASAVNAAALVSESKHLSLEGLHMHLGSQLDEYDSLPVAIDRQVAFARQIADAHAITLSEFSPGGGLSIAYTDQGIDSDPRLWAEVITTSYADAWAKHEVAPGRIVVEPGRWLVGPAAVALYRVGSVKRIAGVRTYVAVDGGMADNIRPSMYEAQYTASVLNREAAGGEEHVRIAGRYCESGDVLIDDLALPAVEVGDLIGMPAAGAYQLPMASNYNAVPRPAVVMVNDGTARIIRNRETYEDVFRNDVFD